MLETEVHPHRLNLGGARVDLMNRSELLSVVRWQLQNPVGPPVCLASANLDHLGHFGAGAPRNVVLGDSERCRWLILLDGKPLQWVAERLTHAPCDLLAGSDLLPDLLSIAEETGARFGLLGGQDETHHALEPVLQHTYPRLTIAGMWAPTREELTNDRGEIAAALKSADVDLLAVALGKPRQEEWLLANAMSSGIRLGLAFGAAPDFLAGTAKRAPEAWREHGLEWAYRLIHEPRRLSRRYLVRGPADAFRLLSASSVPHELVQKARSSEDHPLDQQPPWTLPVQLPGANPVDDGQVAAQCG
jgi:N-acetylglucosaminyldiphosphoundecaprenol N-acetyl-beta-D-mannosaminyltransferase